MTRGPQFKPGDKVVFRSNPFNRDAVARGHVKKLVTDEADAQQAQQAQQAKQAQQAQQTQKYVVKNAATGKESVLTAQDIVSRF